VLFRSGPIVDTINAVAILTNNSKLVIITFLIISIEYLPFNK
jgi:hypothetical protein